MRPSTAAGSTVREPRAQNETCGFPFAVVRRVCPANADERGPHRCRDGLDLPDLLQSASPSGAKRLQDRVGGLRRATHPTACCGFPFAVVRRVCPANADERGPRRCRGGLDLPDLLQSASPSGARQLRDRVGGLRRATHPTACCPNIPGETVTSRLRPC